MITVKSRWAAFSIHLLLSLFIFLCLALIIIFIWYPGVFIHMGGIQGIKIVAGVDIVLGPLLTLIVYKNDKPYLKFDLAIVAIIQFSALFAGCWLVYNERPIFQTISFDGIYIVTQKDVTTSSYELHTKEFHSLPPHIAYLDLPSDPSSRQVISTATEFIEGITIGARFDLYKDFAEESNPKKQELLSTYKYLENKNCYAMKVYSKHFEGSACFDFNKGLINVNQVP